jgi:2-iminobutanoate/2-iminopropanoate deaminase
VSDRRFVPVGEELFRAIGARSRWNDAVVVGDTAFLTGQLGWDKRSGRLAEGIEAQTERTLENVRDVLARAGFGLEDVVHVRVYITEHDHYERYEPIYDRFFPHEQPARVTVVVKELIHHALIDVEAIAVRRRG